MFLEEIEYKTPQFDLKNFSSFSSYFKTLEATTIRFLFVIRVVVDETIIEIDLPSRSRLNAKKSLFGQDKLRVKRHS